MMEEIQRAILIDDEKIDHRLYRKVMHRSGLVRELECFVYADEALDHLRLNRDAAIDVIFLDINMPRMNGFEFLDALKAEMPERLAMSAVVMLTTSTDPMDRARAEASGCVSAFLNKPLCVEDVQHIALCLRALWQPGNLKAAV
ncbi:MAG: response regulator [Pseudomonadota bacterium]